MVAVFSLCSYSFGGKSVPDLLVALMARDKPTDMQLAGAKCLTYLYRADAMTADDSKILYKALPVLVSISYLIEGTVRLIVLIHLV